MQTNVLIAGATLLLSLFCKRVSEKSSLAKIKQASRLLQIRHKKHTGKIVS